MLVDVVMSPDGVLGREALRAALGAFRDDAILGRVAPAVYRDDGERRAGIAAHAATEDVVLQQNQQRQEGRRLQESDERLLGEVVGARAA
mgnify:CR=1 FL=1